MDLISMDDYPDTLKRLSRQQHILKNDVIDSRRRLSSSQPNAEKTVKLDDTSIAVSKTPICIGGDNFGKFAQGKAYHVDKIMQLNCLRKICIESWPHCALVDPERV